MAGEYKWRTPFGKSPDSVYAVARYMPGRKSDHKDNKASYIYGTKEVWNVHSIESATMLAQFYTSDRLDALGVSGENGGIDTLVRLQKLDSIRLYSKSDLIAFGDGAVPIKTVHFEYDYSLCPNTPNSIAANNGKLTLKRLWFTYGKSKRGTLNAYVFSYNDRYRITSDSSKYKYNMAYVDRWGNYKINPADYPDNSLYPYALQDESLTFPDTALTRIHQFAGAWSLRKIETPSGGIIEVQYEADDYAFVQDKRAGQMYFVKGFSTPENPTVIDSFLYHSTDENNTSKYIWVDLEAMHLPDNTLPDTNAVKIRCMQSIENIWFHIDVKMKTAIRENITGYMEYDRSTPLQTAAVVNGNLTAVGIPIKIVETDNGKPIHPVTKAALQTMRLELPDLVYPGSIAGSAFEAFLKSLVGMAGTLKNIFNGFEVAKMKENMAKQAGVTTSGLKTSWIRLCNPRFKKFGGGHRVRQITLQDNWNNMTGKPGAIYGQRYSYTTTHQVKVGAQEQTFTISSGVAAWEPTIGGEENLWKQPVNQNDKIKLAPSNAYYVETPFGESLFPAATVGYSKVTVENLAYNFNERMGAGWSVHQFYTARDFPTKVSYSAPHRFQDRSKSLQRIFKIMAKDHLSLTQGFVVEVNDMHGKPKQESAYAQNGALISQTAYTYKVDNPNAQPLSLNNRVKVITPDGGIGAEKNLGMDVETWNDFREEISHTQGFGMALNTDGFFAAIFPIILLMGKAVLQKEDVRFRSAVTTKYVKRHGVLEKITKMQDGSTITTENLLWDSETGAVLATKTQNEFEDPIYQFTYPAHWAYDGMGMACRNASTRLTGLYFNDGLPYFGAGATNPLTTYTDFITDGDEFGAIRHPARWGTVQDPTRLTAYHVPGDVLRFYTDAGKPFHSDSVRYDLTMLRSGRRNLHNAPIGHIVSKTNPMIYASIQEFSNAASTNNIVNTSASTFRDLWNRDCDCTDGFPLPDTLNPYRNGMKGNWRPEHAYANHLQRKAATMLPTAGITNIRTDGVVQDFTPFWDYITSQWLPEGQNHNSWVRQSTATAYDFKGHQTEQTDALDIYSAALYGYQANLNTAVVHNSRYRQSMFENFEDYPQIGYAPYGFNLMHDCPAEQQVRGCSFRGHPLFDDAREGDAFTSDSIAHTGKISYRVDPSTTYFMETTLDSNTNTTILQPTPGEIKEYVAGSKSCRDLFNPIPGTYLISAWIYTGNACDTVQSEASIMVNIQNNPVHTYTFQPSGPIIDGWQQASGKIIMTANTGIFRIGLVNGTAAPAYFDDIRFHPWHANMKSFVYDPISLRLMAVLDENNYATFYEYDDEGMLIRVKRETERGIMTIEEHRSALRN
jgi:hypothetical protein